MNLNYAYVETSTQYKSQSLLGVSAESILPC